MKCHKCYAENINEAVRCGICGVRLKHQKSFDDFTGSQYVQSSIRRETQKPHSFKQDSNIKLNQGSNSNQHQLTNENLPNNKENKTKNKNNLRKLLISVQEKTLKAQDRNVESPLRNKKVLFFILWAMIIFVVSIIDIMGNSHP
ncbi:hypothetical protein [Acinetobacter sp. Marseille-Q1618]|uniref:hypothetical protein n=1 Tax=Acinetobacter sp. Marseille-Q1618 TaxID=2697502 RepID=UPI0015703154|nr:hypothetical protein [Acinetobacter sp. Marseille-Q1618]